MKIAMMTNSYKPYIAGVPISIERLSSSLKEQGHEVTVFAPSYKGQKEEEGIVRYRSLIKGIAGGFSLPDSMDRHIEKEFVKGNFDIIHVHHPMLIGKTALYLSKKYNVPLVYTYHTRYEQYLHYIKASAFQKVVPSYLKLFLNRCDMIFAPTQCMEAYLNKMGVKAKTIVLPTGLTESSYQTETGISERLRKELAGGKEHLFCTVSRLAKEKNIEFILRSLAIRKERGNDDFRFVLIGDGPYRANLESLAEGLGLTENVYFAGEQKNSMIRHFCDAADLFLFASKSETQGIVLLEAMAAKTPVLAIKATGVEDIVENGKNGYMTEPCEKVYLERMDELLKEKQIKKFGEGAFRTAEKYRAEKIAETASWHYNMAIYRKKQRAAYEEEGKYGILFKNRLREDINWKHIIF